MSAPAKIISYLHPHHHHHYHTLNAKQRFLERFYSKANITGAGRTTTTLFQNNHSQHKSPNSVPLVEPAESPTSESGSRGHSTGPESGVVTSSGSSKANRGKLVTTSTKKFFSFFFRLSGTETKEEKENKSGLRDSSLSFAVPGARRTDQEIHHYFLIY